MRLHHDLLTAPGASPTQAVIFLHGILGTGANLRSHARRFIQSSPHYLAAMVDLRAHGNSLGLDGPDTVANAAADLVETAKSWNVPVQAVVGHSFGGKVALAYAQAHPEVGAVMTLDSAPGPRLDARGSETTMEVLTVLEALGQIWPDRDTFVAAIEAKGQSKMIGQWLAMNLELKPEGWVFRLSLPRVHALLEDYFEIDLWPLVEQAAYTKTGPRFHLVIGARSSVYAHEDRVRAQGLESSSEGHVTVDVLNTGHWLHAEDPQGLSAILQSRLAGP